MCNRRWPRQPLTDLQSYVVSTSQNVLEVNSICIQKMILNLPQGFVLSGNLLYGIGGGGCNWCLKPGGWCALRMGLENGENNSRHLLKGTNNAESLCVSTSSWCKECLPQSFSVANGRLKILREIGLTSMEKKLKIWHWSCSFNMSWKPLFRSAED